MTQFKSEFLHTLNERGFIHQGTNLEALDDKAAKGQITGYIGFDATANSLHIGNLVSITLLRWLQKTGHKPIALLGGGTTKVGDPSGRDETRQLLDEKGLAQNIVGIKNSLSKFLDFKSATLVNNADWLDKLEYIPFLREVGRHFSVNRMLSFDSVKLRLDREQSLSFLEFNYMILQAYDFVELYKRENCVLQMGGSDQWGNIVNGVELGRRMMDAELFGLTTPLLTTSSGAKMGKSASGAVWLNEDRLSPYDYYQYWRNTEDAGVGRFLALFTELPMDEVKRLGALQGAEINEAKEELAERATELCHGKEAAQKAKETARQVFGQGKAAEGLPTYEITQADIRQKTVADLLLFAGLSESKGKAKQLVKEGGARLNDQIITDAIKEISLDDFKDGTLKLSAGRKRHVLVRIV